MTEYDTLKDVDTFNPCPLCIGTGIRRINTIDYRGNVLNVENEPCPWCDATGERQPGTGYIELK